LLGEEEREGEGAAAAAFAATSAAASAQNVPPLPNRKNKQDCRPSPLARGGTLADAPVAASTAPAAAASAAPAAAARAAVVASAAAAAAPAAPAAPAAAQMSVSGGRFLDDRWVGGRWDLARFAGKGGETDWDAVIDAEMARRKMLEDAPIPCTNEDPVNFDTAEIPWWAWVRRFHLPEAEKLNGRAAMLGYVLAGLVDLATGGAGLVEQQESFLGKLALHVCVFGVLLVRQTADLDRFKGLVDEATFYDKQWSAAWDGVPRPSETEKSS